MKVELEIAETKITSDPKLTHKSYLYKLMMDSEQYTLNYAQILPKNFGYLSSFYKNKSVNIITHRWSTRDEPLGYWIQKLRVST